MNTQLYYLILYIVVLITAFFSTYYHLIDNSILVAALSMIIGHGIGLFTPIPDGGKNNG